MLGQPACHVLEMLHGWGMSAFLLASQRGGCHPLVHSAPPCLTPGQPEGATQSAHGNPIDVCAAVLHRPGAAQHELLWATDLPICGALWCFANKQAHLVLQAGRRAWLACEMPTCSLRIVRHSMPGCVQHPRPAGCPSLLQHIDISTPQQSIQPLQVSVLTNLKILYLHGAFSSRAAASEMADWDALRPLTSLRFLAISGNRLPALPPAVAQMTHLHVGCNCSHALLTS